jgi:Arc/MetJ-type ribon-helix-helix transcriptional regulator
MKMDAHINLRLPRGVYAVIEQRARRLNTSVSEVIRQAMTQAIGDGERPAAKEVN